MRGILSSESGISAIGSAVAVAVGVSVAGGMMVQFIEQTRNAAVMKGAREIAEQVNKTALETTMQLLQSKSLQKQTTGGVTTWSQVSTASSPSWTFTPAVGATPATILFNFCDPRFADPTNPASLTACASNIVHARVSLAAVEGDNEVTAATSVPLSRGSTKMETASSRAILNYSAVSCPGAPTVTPGSTLLSGETFSLQVSNIVPANSTVTLISTGGVFTGTSTKSLTLTAPTIPFGNPSQSFTYVARVTAPNGAFADCPAVSVTVSPCKPYVSDEPVKEIYRQILVSDDSQINQTTISSAASEVALGTQTIGGLWQSLYDSAAFGTRSGATASAVPAQREIAYNVIAMTRNFINRGDTNANVKTRSDSIRQMLSAQAGCVYSNTYLIAGFPYPCSTYTGIYGSFPKLSTTFSASSEFVSAPNSGSYHSTFIDEQYLRFWGITAAQMTPSEQTQRTGFINALRTGTAQFGLKTTSGSILNQITTSPRYIARGGDAGENVNSLYRVLYGRSATDSEASYFGGLQNTQALPTTYISQRLRSNAEFRSVGGCQVPPPLPVCNIAAPASLQPGQTATITLTGLESLTYASWDGATLSTTGTGVESFQKSVTAGAVGTTTTTTATVRNSGGEVTCSATIQSKKVGRSAQARRGCNYCTGADPIPCNNTRNNYEGWKVYLEDMTDMNFAHSNIEGWGVTADSQDAGRWFPDLITNGWISCYFVRNWGDICAKLAAAPPVTSYAPIKTGNYCYGSATPMPATWLNPADGMTYQLMTNPSTGLAANAFQGGVCGSADVPCYLKAQVSPLYLELSSALVEFAPGTLFDMTEGPGNYFWPKPTAGGHWLVLDRNNNGKIDDANELFGNVTKNDKGEQAYTNGFQALAAYDLNQDKFIDAKDAVFSRLMLWSDQNRNGTSEPSELRSISSKNVKNIDLSYLDIQELNDFYGNKSNQRSVVEMEDGTWNRIYDLWIMPSGSVTPQRSVAAK